MSISIQFIGVRAPATLGAQELIALDWVWPERTVPEWETAVGDFEEQIEVSLIAEAVMEGARGALGVAMVELHELTSQYLNLLKNTYRNNMGKYEVVNDLVAMGGSRGAIILEALELEAAWLDIDPLWTPLPTKTLAGFTALREAAQTKLRLYLNKRRAWRGSVGDLNELAVPLNEACVGWYAAATLVFPEGTSEGDMIRNTVPTTTEFTSFPDVAELTLVDAGPGTYTVGMSAEHATKFDVYQKLVAETDWVKVGVEVPPGNYVKTGLVAGAYQIKVQGRNSRGAGPDSNEVTVDVG